MNIFTIFEERIRAALEALRTEGALPADAKLSGFVVEPPREATHGDLATNAAMVLAKPAGKNPKELAALIAERIRQAGDVEKVDVAGPGFINITLKAAFWPDVLRAALNAGPGYGRSALGAAAPVNVEYVSANPTGPMHVGHTRGAVFGDALASLLAFAGYEVTREYYINDGGAQVDVLARSAYLRYREALGEHRRNRRGALSRRLPDPGREALKRVRRQPARPAGREWLAGGPGVATDAMMDDDPRRSRRC